MGVFADRVNERSKGELIIKWLGGPEVIGMFEQPGAVRTGTVDLTFVPSAFYRDIVPEAFAMFLAEYYPWEQRENGFYDWMLELHEEKMNVYYLGRVNSNEQFYTFLNVRVNKPQELADLKIQSTGLKIPAVKGMGASPIIIREEEVYTAMERGVVDGAVQSMSTVVPVSLFEVSKYFIDHGYYESNVTAIMNLDTWNRIPRHLQDIMIDIIIELEREWGDFFAETGQKGKAKIIEEGVEPIKFSAEDAKWYIDHINEAGWQEVQAVVSPETIARLKEFLVK